MDTTQRQTYTPMMQQYLEIKEDYADAIVFFRLATFMKCFLMTPSLLQKYLEIALDFKRCWIQGSNVWCTTPCG
jgi:DNA mismatch repair protein MutS